MAVLERRVVKAGFKDLTCPHLWEFMGRLFNLKEADRRERQSERASDLHKTNASEVDETEEDFALPARQFQPIIADMGIKGLSKGRTIEFAVVGS